jgi:hypothetical protein
MYDLIYNNQIYSSYLIIRPKKGFTKLTEPEISQAGALIMTGAMTTVDTLLGKKQETQKVDKKGAN